MRAHKQPFSVMDKLLSLIETRKTSDRIFLRTLFFVSLFVLLAVLFTLNERHSLQTPTQGGTLKEGIIGIPRFINPALAITRADQDTVALLYGGLMRIDQKGDLVPNIAESITLSDDGRTYTVVLRKDRTFHDDTPITARDAIYTIKLIQDPELKSPLRGNWADVVITEVDEYTFTATLRQPYAPFIENFTVGIMPHHIWSKLPIEQLPFSNYNTEPVGSGQFSLTEVHRDEAGLIKEYELTPFANADVTANLASVELHYFTDEESLITAFKNGDITSTAYLPAATVRDLDPDTVQIVTSPLPRIFGVFFNQNRSASLRDIAARQALSVAVDRPALIDTVLSGYGVPIDKPTLPTGDALELTSTSTLSSIDAATEILLRGGWEKNDAGFWEKEISNRTEILSITIKTSNLPLFNEIASSLEATWRSLGAEVTVEQYDQTDLVQSVIRPRDFQALLFGLDMNRTEDLFPFWHSSQKDDPGLNVAQYTNIAIDRLLEQARTPRPTDERKNLQAEISTAISTEYPAVFLFAPQVLYVVEKSLIISPLMHLSKPSDRFMNIEHWYAKTEKLWPIFRNENIESIN